MPSLGRAASPGSRSKIRDIERSKRLGTTIWLDLDSAPFPHGRSRWTDPTVIVYVPKHFRVHKRMKVDALIHFHGHRDTADAAMKRHQLREQLRDSKQNAILIVPQGPVKAQSCDFGKLEQPRGYVNLLSEVRRTLQSTRVGVALRECGIPRRARIGRTIISCHSGGYRVAAACAEQGGWNVNEVWLFDALYGRMATFRDWIVAARKHRGVDRHKLISYYSGEKLTANNATLMGMLDRSGIRYLHETQEGALTRKQLSAGRAVFIRSRTDHQGMMYRHNNLRDCLFASCFKRYLRADWYEDGDTPRELEKRG